MARRLADCAWGQVSQVVNIVTALAAEARPLAAHWGLEAETCGPYQVFSSERIRLIAAGVGQPASAAGAALLHALDDCRENRVWLNFGIAGARQFDDGDSASVGDLIWGARIVDESVRQARRAPSNGPGETWRKTSSWFPPLPTLRPEHPGTIRTVLWVERDYADRGAYEMEAAGFMSVATRYSTAELVHVVKVISDTPDSPVDQLDRARIERLVADRAADLDPAIDSLIELAATLEGLVLPPDWPDSFLERWRFTVTQRRTLERLLKRWRALHSEPPDLSTFDVSSAAGCLRTLDEQLSRELPGVRLEVDLR